MARVMIVGVMLVFFLATAACAGNEVAIGGESGTNELGIVPIGGVPRNMGVFVSSDCGKWQPKFADCSAQDGEGRRYVFFDGALSKVSAIRNQTTKTLRLPASLEFGEEIESAAEKIGSDLGVKLDRSFSHDGRIVYSSDFVVRSSAGVLYSIELIADEKGRLIEVVERTDF